MLKARHYWNQSGVNGVQTSMRYRWRIILPVLGLLPFCVLTYTSIQRDRDMYHGRWHRSFYWGAMRLDRDPLGRHLDPPHLQTSCRDEDPDCVSFDPIFIWIDPSPLERALMLAALPAFITGTTLVTGLGKLGINQVSSFMISMPLLISAWFYFLGWLLDLWRFKRQQRRAVTVS